LFQPFFVKYQISRCPKHSALFESEKPDESYLGLIVLFRRYPNNLDFWSRLIQHLAIERRLRYRPSRCTSWRTFLGMATLLTSENPLPRRPRPTSETCLARFSREQVVKLLGFIDEEGGISRGAVGQSVEAIISSLPNASTFLKDIVLDRSLEPFIRECAALILAMNEGASAIPIVEQLEGVRSWYVTELVEHIKQYGGINPYA
jgi:hypothetical protein